MAGSFAGRSFLTLRDYTPKQITRLLDRAAKLKSEQGASSQKKRQQRLAGYSLALLFEKRSTRTRCAFETAFGEEGGHVVFLSPQDIHLGVKETIEDTARVLGRMFDGIQFRGYRQDTLQTLAEWSGIPVYNGLTDLYHPTQALADLLTIREEFGDLSGRTVVYLGDGRNNVANSLAIGCAKLGINCRIASPGTLQPNPDVWAVAGAEAEESGATLDRTTDVDQAVVGADVLYTDVWVSMGEEQQEADRLKALRPFQVTNELLEATGNPHSIFLHCLPAVRGNEVTADVLEGPRSRVWDQAENRKHTIKAVVLESLGV